MIMLNLRHSSFNQQFSNKVDTDRKQALHSILSHQPIDLVKLKNFVLCNYLPSDHRILVWKLLLAITPCFTESQEFVHRQHALIYDDLFTTLKVLRLGVPISYQNDAINGNLGMSTSLRLHRNGFNGQIRENCNPEPEHFFFMWLISNARLHRDPERQLNAAENQKFILIGHKLSNCNLFDNNNNIDIFHVCSSLWSLLSKHEHKLKESVQNAFGLLKKQNEALHSHLWTMKLFNSSLFDDHSSSLFCEILTDSAFENIVDKIFAGSFAILSYVIVALLCQLQNELMTASSVESIRNVLYQIRPEQADSALISALDEWHKLQERTNGNHFQEL